MSFEHLTDFDKLKSLRVKNTVSGVHLKAWLALSQHLPVVNKEDWLENRLVTFTETGDEFVIFIKQPRTQQILGGGDAECRLSKVDYSLIKYVFSR